MKTGKKIFLNKKTPGGYAILELIFYIALFVVISLVVIDSMIVMSRSFKETTVLGEFQQTSSMMERVSREIRQAIDVASLNPTDFVLTTKDDAGVDKTVEISLSGGNLVLTENSVVTGNLNAPGITVAGANFKKITTAKSKAVKISLSLQATNDPAARTVNLYDTVVLRGSY